MPNFPEFHFRVPPRKVKRVVNPVWDYPTIDRITEHILGNKKMSVYQMNLHDINKDGKITIAEMLHSIKTSNDLTVVSVTPAVNLEVGVFHRVGVTKGKGGGADAPGDGGGGEGG